MPLWLWAVCAAALVGWLATGYGWRVVWLRLAEERRAHAVTTSRWADLQTDQIALHAELTSVKQAWQIDHDRTVDAWEADRARWEAAAARDRADAVRDREFLQADLAYAHTTLTTVAAQVTALSHATELSDAAVQARKDWAAAYQQNFTPTGHLAADGTPPKGWQCVLLTGDGKVESIRAIRDGTAPTRITRAHGATQDQYRLARVDGLSLIYEPEMTP